MKELSLAAAFLLALSPMVVLDAGDCDTFSGEEITLELVTAGFSQPTDAQSAPGDTARLFVVQQRGLIRVVDIVNDSLGGVFLDIRSKVSQSGNERGLLGMVFHRNYFGDLAAEGPGVGEFFVNYTRGSDGATIVARYRVSEENPNLSLAATEEIILTIAQPFGNHNAGQIAFGPLDGMLYVATGDGGSGGDPGNRSQNPAELLGSMLRIDVDGGSPYAVPADNPFLAAGDGIRDEIWSLGLRNPWRFAFDPQNGDLYIADVGQNAWEEINWVPASSKGENYEWRVREGLHTHSGGTPYGPGTRVAPILEYPHGSGFLRGNSITGGVPYRGCRMPDLHGVYFFSDYERDWVGTLRVEDGGATDVRDRTGDFNANIAPRRIGEVTSFGTDARGEVYLCDRRGLLYRVIPSDSVNHPPTASVAVDPDPAEVMLVNGSAEVSLDGSGSDDGNGGTQTLTFEWEKVSGPDGDTIDDSSAEMVVVTFTRRGDYTYRLTVDDGDLSDSAEVDVVVRDVPFRRADTNQDVELNLTDGVMVLRFLFQSQPAVLECDDAGDSDDNGSHELNDGVFTFRFLFSSGTEPPLPGPSVCGEDPTDDDLGCATPPDDCL